MLTFNTTGPVDTQDHYCIPPLARMDLEYVLNLIRRKKYFILHAPRQTGKTSALKALQDLHISGTAGDYRCLYLNVEAAEAARQDVSKAMETILDALASRAQDALADHALERICDEVLAKARPGNALYRALNSWARSDQRPLVLLIDEIDALVGDSLISVLHQLRSGYDLRPKRFPHSIVLCGVRDVRDYRIHSGSTGETIAGGSAFNISAASLRLRDFDRAEVETLLGQHTEETGQQVQPAAVARVHAQTAGQPWLVNALCYEACFENPQGRDRSRPITEDAILAAQQVLIQGRVMHLGQLADTLREERVQRVIKPLLSGAVGFDFSRHDYEYVRDLGLIAPGDEIRIANPIYAEVIPRELTVVTQNGLASSPRGT